MMSFIKTTSIAILFFCLLSSNVQAQNKTSILRSAKTIFINARSEFMNAQAFERELMKLPEFDEWGLTLIHKKEPKEQVDLQVEVYRKRWTTRFTITVMDSDAKIVLATCEETSLGGEIEPKLARCLIKILRAAKARYTTEK